MATNPDLSVDRHSLYSMEFDGAQYISIPATITGTLNTRSVSFWFKTSTISSFKGLMKFDTTNGKGCIKVFTHSSKIQVNGVGSDGVTNAFQVMTSTLSNDTWYHICIVSSPNTPEGKIYVNGVEDTNSGGAGTSADVDSFSYIGKLKLNSRAFNGKIDEVAVFNTALTLGQIQALSDSKDSPVNIMAFNPKPIAYYPLGEQARNTGYLSSGSDVSGSEWQFPNQSIQSTVVDFENSGAPAVGQTGDNIELGSTINLGTQNTISFWFKSPSPNPVTNDRFCMIGNQYTSGKYTIFIFDNQILYRVGNNTGGYLSWTITGGGAPLLDNKWHNIIVNRNGASASLYIDSVDKGAPAGTIVATDNTFIDKIGSTGPLTINYYYNGEMSNVVAWNSDQTSEKDNIYNNGSPATSYTNTPTAWYKLNAANSSYNTSTSTWTFTDSAGSNNGTSTTLPTSALVRSDLQFESPYSNFSLDFDGATNYIDFPDKFNFVQTTGVFSTSIWLKLDDYTSNAVQAILGTNYTSVNIGFYLWYDNRSANSQDRALRFQFANGSTNQLDNPQAITDNNWHLINVVGDGTTIKIYKDGVQLSNTLTISGSTSSEGFHNLRIGANTQSPAAVELNGKLDECAIFNKALTQSEISQVYNNGLASDLTSLSPTSWWRLGEDAYFVNNNITIPNQITGGPSGTGSGTQTSMLVADAPGSYGSGSGVNLDIVDRVGEAPGISPVNVGNSQSYNMIPDDRHSYVPGYVPAQINNIASMSFDGINDYFDAPVSALNSSTAFSVSVWFKLAASSSILILGDIITTNSSGFSLSYDGQWSTVRFRTMNGSNMYLDFSLAGDTNWHHFVGVFESDSNKIYHNGGLVATSTAAQIPTTMPSTFGNGFKIGSDSAPSETFGAGNIDEVAIFNYALTPKQIKEDIYNASTTGKTADLNNNSNLTAPVAWYRMGD